MYKIVVDTNVIISAWINKAGKPRQFLTKYLTSDKCVFILSNEIIDEVRKVVGKPKFKMRGNDIDELLYPIILVSQFVEIKSNLKIIERDPADDVIINTAYDGDADYIVSGDAHLLDLKKYDKI